MLNRFELLEWGWARVSHVYSYHKHNVHGAEWGIKGHNRPWIITQGRWEAGLRFLDVGAGYSDLPAYLIDRYEMEGWVADDFGMSSCETLWSRWGDPRELAKKYPKVKYVFKNVGTPEAWKEFPKAYFDRIYSISTLEHIPGHVMNDVFSHMIAMLKPGGIMLHAIDIPYDIPLERYESFNLPDWPILRGAVSLAWQMMGHWGATRMCVGKNYYPGTVSGWAHFLKKPLSITSGKNKIRSTSFFSFAMDPDVLLEPIDIVYKVYPPNNTPKPFRRMGSLIFILRSLND